MFFFITKKCKNTIIYENFSSKSSNIMLQFTMFQVINKGKISKSNK